MKIKEDFNGVNVAWIVFTILAVIFIFWVTSCSPSDRLSRHKRQLAKIKRHSPQLFQLERDTIIKTRTVIDTFIVNLPTDTVSFKGNLKEYVRVIHDTVLIKDPDQKFKQEAYKKALERELMKGVFKPFSERFTIVDTV